MPTLGAEMIGSAIRDRNRAHSSVPNSASIWFSAVCARLGSCNPARDMVNGPGKICRATV